MAAVHEISRPPLSGMASARFAAEARRTACGGEARHGLSRRHAGESSPGTRAGRRQPANAAAPQLARFDGQSVVAMSFGHRWDPVHGSMLGGPCRRPRCRCPSSSSTEVAAMALRPTPVAARGSQMRRIAVSVAQHLPALVASEGAEQTEVTAENRALLNHRVNDRNPSVPDPSHAARGDGQGLDGTKCRGLSGETCQLRGRGPSAVHAPIDEGEVP
jgi:hypothetical protein